MNKHDSQENLSIPGRFKMLRPPKLGGQMFDSKAYNMHN